MIDIYATITYKDSNNITHTLLTLDHSNITNISIKINSVAYLEVPSFGPVAGSGSISYNDFNGDVLTYKKQGLLKALLLVTVWLRNTITGKKEQLGSYETKKWDYDKTNKVVTIELFDIIEKLQDVNVKNFFPNMGHLSKYPENTEVNLRSLVPQKILNTLRDQDFQTYLKSYFTVSNPYLDDASLWSEYNKLCNAFPARMFRYKNGNIYIKPEYEISDWKWTN